MDSEAQASNCPKFIFVDSQYLKFDILSKEPKLADLISDDLNDDVAIVVASLSLGNNISISDKGVISVDRNGFESIMGKIWSFVDSYKSGTSVRKSVLTLINKLEEGKTQ